MNMVQPELSKLQINILQVFKKVDSQETVTGVARSLKLETALSKSQLDRLAELNYLRIKHVGTSQVYVMQPAGVNYLRQMVNAPTIEPKLPVGEYTQQHNQVFTLVEEAGSFGISAKALSERLDISRLVANQLLEQLLNGGRIKKWSNGMYHIPAVDRASARVATQEKPVITPLQASESDTETATATAAGQLQDERLEAVKKSLAELDKKIQFPPQILVTDYELKQEVLHRLAQFFDDSISAVLTDIRTDLHNIHTLNSGVQQ